ncbi:MAG: HAMP domain-containing histidine kinase [Gemmatimonadetes bacterium]|nr:HAMP domain-containing histidine kinase [Gemmatimonadota bacterium]
MGLRHEPDESVAVQAATRRIDELRAITRALAEETNVLPILRLVAETVRAATDAIAVHIERTDSDDVQLLVVAPDTTEASADNLNHRIDNASRIVIALGRRSKRLGTLVLFRADDAAAVQPDALARVGDLATFATLALHRASLVTEAERTREECRRVVEDKYRLISGISDELKDRLGIAMEYGELLHLETELTERQRGYLARSRESIEAVVRIINDLVQLSRVDTGRVTPAPELVRLDAVLRGIVRDYELAMGTIGFRFDVDVPDDLPVIETDIDLVRQILDNLLSNAVRYTPVGETITVTADVRTGRRKADPMRYVCLSVADCGPGVGDSDLIFEEVYRVERRGERTGFRLAISRRLARVLGGEITLETEPGRGSVFTLWLPDTPPDSAPSYTDLKQQTDAALLR